MRLNKLKFRQNYLEYFPLKLLSLLLITDLIFILLYIFCWLPNSSFLSTFLSKIVLHQEMLWLTEEQSYAEIFQYIKELWIVLILASNYWQFRKAIFLVWGLLFNYILLDDSLRIHEIVGSQLSEALGFTSVFNLRAVDFGEFLVSVTVGIGFLIAIAFVHYHGNSQIRKYSKILIFLLFSLATTGIIFDLIHVIVYDNNYLNLSFALLEDGGEQIIMSFILSFVYINNCTTQ